METVMAPLFGFKGGFSSTDWSDPVDQRVLKYQYNTQWMFRRHDILIECPHQTGLMIPLSPLSVFWSDAKAFCEEEFPHWTSRIIANQRYEIIKDLSIVCFMRKADAMRFKLAFA